MIVLMVGLQLGVKGSRASRVVAFLIGGYAYLPRSAGLRGGEPDYSNRRG